MTSAALVMNNRGVALATDSALTVFTKSGPKVQQSVNKIYTLSTDPPVALMVYGELELAGIPWETLSWAYGRACSPAPTLAKTAAEFVDWLSTAAPIDPAAIRRAWEAHLEYIAEEFVPRGSPVTSRLARRERRFLTDKLGDELQFLVTGGQFFTGVSEKTVSEQLKANSQQYDDVVEPRFEKHPSLDALRNRLLKILAWSTGRPMLSAGSTGLVFTGFGVDDLVPSSVQLIVTVEREEIRISPLTTTAMNGAMALSHVASFGENDNINAYLDGVHPDLTAEISGEWSRSNETIQSLKGLLASNASPLPGAFEDELKQIIDDHGRVGTRSEFSTKQFLAPMLQGIEKMRPKELGDFAEFLIGLECRRHHTSTSEYNTVGGDIKVAILSRASGIEQWTRSPAIAAASVQ